MNFFKIKGNLGGEIEEEHCGGRIYAIPPMAGFDESNPYSWVNKKMPVGSGARQAQVGWQTPLVYQ